MTGCAACDGPAGLSIAGRAPSVRALVGLPWSTLRSARPVPATRALGTRERSVAAQRPDAYARMVSAGTRRTPPQLRPPCGLTPAAIPLSTAHHDRHARLQHATRSGSMPAPTRCWRRCIRTGSGASATTAPPQPGRLGGARAASPPATRASSSHRAGQRRHLRRHQPRAVTRAASSSRSWTATMRCCRMRCSAWSSAQRRRARRRRAVLGRGQAGSRRRTLRGVFQARLVARSRSARTCTCATCC